MDFSGKAEIKRAAITAALNAIALGSAARLLPTRGTFGAIFTLHHVRPPECADFAPNAHLSVTPEFLDETLSALLADGFEPAPLSTVPERMAAGRKGGRWFCITLDDGNIDNAGFAAPVFRRHGVPFSIFIAKGLSEHTQGMWWETADALLRAVKEFSFDFGTGEERVVCGSVKDKKAAFGRLADFVSSGDEAERVGLLDAAALAVGVDAKAIVARTIMDPGAVARLAADPLCSIGAHTVSHCNLARVDDTQLVHEIAESVDAVEAWTGRRPDSFAYPYGLSSAFGEREADAVRNAGLALAVTTRPGILVPGTTTDFYRLPRISLNGYFQKVRHVRALMTGLSLRHAA